MKYAVWICVALLLVLHQDYWQWGNTTLDFGFMPRALTYHAVVSIVAAFLWLVATYVCWPSDLADAGEHSDQNEEASS